MTSSSDSRPFPQDTSDVEKDWELFKLGLMASASRCCGKKYIGPAPDGRLRTSWWTDEVRDIVREKKLAFDHWLNDKSEANRQRYNELKHATKEAVKKAKGNLGEHSVSRSRTAIGMLTKYSGRP